MNKTDNTKETLLIELEALQRKYESLKIAFDKEVSDRENEKLLLEKLNLASEELIQLQNESQDYTKILETLTDISGAKYVALNVFDQEGLGFTTVAISGVKDIYKDAVSFLGYNLINKHWDHDPARAEKTKGQTITRFKDLGELTGETIPKSVVFVIEKTFRLGEIFIIKVTRDTKVIGDFTLMFQKGKTLANNKFVNLLTQQVGLFIERNNIVDSLKVSHSRHNAMISNISDVIGIVNTKGSVKYISPNIKKWFGWDPKNLIGTQIWSTIHPNDLAKIQEQFHKILQLDNLSVTVEYNGECGDGSYKPIRLTATNLVNDQNIEGILFNFHDITEQKKADNELKLRESYLSAIIENQPGLIWLKDLEGKFLTANTKFSKLFSFQNPEMLVGKTDFDICDRILAEKYAIEDAQVIETGKPSVIEESFIRNEGITWFETFKTPIFDKNGSVIGTTGVSRNITERKKAEKTLLESKKTYQSLVENISDVIFTLDTNGTFTYISPIIKDVIGLNPEAVIGKNFSEFVHPKDLPALMESLGETMRGAKTPFEFRASHGGEVRYVRTSSHLTTQDGVVTGLNGIMTDITKRKEAEEALISKTALLEAQIETTTDGILVIDRNKQIGLINNRFIELFEVPPHIANQKEDNQLIEHIIGLVKHPEKLYKKVMHLLENRQEATNDEIEFLNGMVLDWYSAPIVGKDKRSYGRIWTFRDITERKKAQELLQKSELRYRSLFQNSPSGIVIIDKNGIILEANEAFTKITLYPLGELIGHDVRLLTSPGYEHTVELNIKRILSGEVLEQEVMSQRKDGTFCTLLLREIAIVLPNGSKGILSVSNDISERKKAEKDLAIKNDELVKIVAEKDKFFSIISHDLRSPFNGFLGLTQMMADNLQGMDLDDIQNIAQTMSKSASNLYRLLENLLEWSRIEQGLVPFNPKLLSLKETMDDVFSTVLETANNKKIGLTIAIPDNLRVYADSNIIETVLRNLVSNAIKFTPSGGNISIEAKMTDNQNLLVSVKDSGIGMKKELVEKLFLITGNISRRGTDDEPSTGIGLFLCKGFIEKHGGSIWAESEEGKGSVFYFSIPVAEMGA
ncbi:MAG: PAS domain-containing sensor histidine kinase [Bacteroidales bacterium]